MVLPSKELLIAIGLDVNIHTDLYYDGNFLIIHNQYQEEVNVNIYELMHMMKELAISKKVYILSNISFIGGTARTINGSEDNLFVANTELEAVTIACEWILEQQK